LAENEDTIRTGMLDEFIVELMSKLVEAKKASEERPGTKNTMEKRNEWWTPEMERLKKLRWICFVLWRTYKYREFRIRLKEARKNFKRQMKLEKNKVERAKALRLNKKFRKQRIFFWKSVKNERQEDVKPNIELDELIAHYRPLLTAGNKDLGNVEYDGQCRDEVNGE